MKSRIDSSSGSQHRSWIEGIVDFLLGPSPHPVHLAGAAAGFSDTGRLPDRKRIKRVRREGGDADSAYMALAAAGMSAYGATNSSHGSEGGRR